MTPAIPVNGNSVAAAPAFSDQFKVPEKIPKEFLAAEAVVAPVPP